MTYRELDAMVAEKVMGWDWHISKIEGIPNGEMWGTHNPSCPWRHKDWSPTTSMDAAMEVAMKVTVRTGYGLELWVPRQDNPYKPNGYCEASFENAASATAWPPAKAICLAALKAVGHEIKEPA